MRRRSAGSILIGNLDPNLKERILNIQLSNQVLKKFEEEEKIEEVSCIMDLRELSTKTESEVYNTLNRMFKNKQ
jgi:hypothetical protein